MGVILLELIGLGVVLAHTTVGDSVSGYSIAGQRLVGQRRRDQRLSVVTTAVTCALLRRMRLLEI